MKKLKFDKEKNKFVRVEEIETDSREVKRMKEDLQFELVQIVQQVKALKVRADEIRQMIKLLDEEEGPEGPSVNPVQFPVQ